MNVLSFRFVLHDPGPDDEGGIACLHPLVDGRDVLDGARLSRGCDPDDLLRRRAVELLPLGGRRDAAIGVCSCGELGCRSFRVSISRQADVVQWSPAEHGETTAETYRFALVDYLDALEDARELRPFEGRGRGVAREVRRQLLEDPDETRRPLLDGVTQIEWVASWPWTSDVVRAGVTPAGAALEEVLDFIALTDEDDVAFALRIVQALWALARPA